MSTPPHIVVVDDNVDILTLYQEYMPDALDSLGHPVQITTFKSGQSLLAAAQRGSLPDFDLMLLDFDMPGIAGDEVCRHLRERGYRRQFIVFLSALQGDSHKQLAREAGANAYSRKVVKGQLMEQFVTLYRIAHDHAFPDPAPDWLVVF